MLTWGVISSFKQFSKYFFFCCPKWARYLPRKQIYLKVVLIVVVAERKVWKNNTFRIISKHDKLFGDCFCLMSVYHCPDSINLWFYWNYGCLFKWKSTSVSSARNNFKCEYNPKKFKMLKWAFLFTISGNYNFNDGNE